ncbi:MAG: phospho-sugar mutase [Puniceicoccales bacterium]|jgi:phosphoglucomutase|nr:phospho-sugar mutase [Puniceicoccales bacterium]
MDEILQKALKDGSLLPQAAKNCGEWFRDLPQWGKDSIAELLENGNWRELNDRFFRNLELGTGGMRSRTIGENIPREEQGRGSLFGTPEHAAIGSAYLNDFNIARATIALFRYCKTQSDGPLKLVIAHDVRHFSEHFSTITAKIWNELGGKAIAFDGPRSTHQLSFSVRKFEAIAGIVITASHNPPQDNGYKIYFKDGGQVVEPHASKIIEYFNATPLIEAVQILESIGKNQHPISFFDATADKNYMEEVLSNLFDGNIFRDSPIHIVFTPVHGTGDIITAPLLQQLSIHAHFVETQMAHDPRFPTVKSPNPENFEVFDLAIQRAKEVGGELLFATDPDGDRIAIGIPNGEGKFEQFSGNLTGALLAEFRLSRMKQLGWLNRKNASHFAFLKTFVTSPLQDKIAERYGVKCINTLTGFKWIGEKLNDYENILQKQLALEQRPPIDYVNTPAATRRKLLLEHSTFFAFGGEESYGYLGSDNVRDKDANAATLMICEMFAFLKKSGKTLIDFRNEIYAQYGYYDETQLNIYYEGASGAEKIGNILQSYGENPPTALGHFHVTRIVDFNRDAIFDPDGKPIPRQNFFMVDLDNGYRYALRGSGTEPKIKFYIFANAPISSAHPIETVSKQTAETMAILKDLLQRDAHGRSQRN